MENTERQNAYFGRARNALAQLGDGLFSDTLHILALHRGENSIRGQPKRFVEAWERTNAKEIRNHATITRLVGVDRRENCHDLIQGWMHFE